MSTATTVVTVSGRAFVEALVADAHPLVVQWLGAERLAENLSAHVATQVAWMTREAFAASYCEQFTSLGLPPSHFNNRLVPVGDRGRLIAGIRFKGLDVSLPFVDVWADFPLADDETLAMVARTVECSFDDIAPLAFRCWNGQSANAPVFCHHATAVDQYLLAAPVADIQARPLPRGYDRLTLVSCIDLSFFRAYEAAYEDFHRCHPERAANVTMETRDSFTAALAEGLLFEAYVDGVWAGLVAAESGTDICLSGYLVREELLATAFRGQGLGPVLQRHLAERLDGCHENLLFGSIHPHNVPSFRTARANGRMPVGALHFVAVGFPDVLPTFERLTKVRC